MKRRHMHMSVHCVEPQASCLLICSKLKPRVGYEKTAEARETGLCMRVPHTKTCSRHYSVKYQIMGSELAIFLDDTYRKSAVYCGIQYTYMHLADDTSRARSQLCLQSHKRPRGQSSITKSSIRNYLVSGLCANFRSLLQSGCACGGSSVRC